MGPYCFGIHVSARDQWPGPETKMLMKELPAALEYAHQTIEDAHPHKGPERALHGNDQQVADKIEGQHNPHFLAIGPGHLGTVKGDTQQTVKGQEA